MAGYFIGVDLGGTNIKLGCFDEAMALVGRTSVPTDADMGPDHVIGNIVKAGQKLLKKAKLTEADLAAIGIGTPGPADYANGIIIRSTNMPKFVNTPLRDRVAQGLGNKPAILENDANVACWGEFAMGAGKDVGDMIFMTLGTGIGGGVVCNGELVRGVGGNAAELGHVIIYPGGRACNCGQRGCVEAYASANSTAARAVEAIRAGEVSSLKTVLDKKGELTSKDVFQHAENGDALAREIVEGTAESLAIMCVNMLHTTEPARIVFSGGMIAAGDALLSRIQHYFDEHIWTLKKETVNICFATLGEDTGIIGAASLARHALQHGQIGGAL
ncbi:MAG TPA: ROK family protein [Phycisphaerales bacterium]|nr:ROK family protein [Phycisphaerales bacterium]